MDVEPVKNYLLDLQTSICEALEKEDGKQQFIVDEWTKPHGGNGRTMAFEGGAAIERAAVNYSCVHGDLLPKAATAKRQELAGRGFEVAGVSLIIHPLNPYAPTCHLNVRLFKATKPNEDPIWWFGGGFDLTPYYGFEEDCVHWHQIAKQACDPFGEDVYPRYKKEADDYFYLKHRDEQRGIGGIFFDDLNEWGFEKCFDFIKSVGDHFIPAYLPILQKRKSTDYGNRERDFQTYRRGRYVEFNLVYDRGTLFGLQFGGRIESILCSLPPVVRWKYNQKPEPGSREAELYDIFLPVRDWV